MSGPLKYGSAAADHLGVLDCIHCGLCIEHCPTYIVTGRESANPRGRIYLMRALLEGRVDPSPVLEKDLDLCLLCRACESACPSGVRFGEVMGEVRHRIRRQGFARRFLMNRVLLRPRRLAFIMGLLRFYQRSGLRVVRHLFPQSLRRIEASMPVIPAASDRVPLPEHTPARGARLGAVGLLEGCVMPQMFGDVNRDTVRLLSEAGYDVIVPKRAVCCGALHSHDGALDTARELAQVNVEAFGDADISHVVINSAGCGAGLVDSRHLLGTDEAGALASKVVDVTRFLLDHGGRLQFRPQKMTVASDSPCHLLHGLGESTSQVEILKRIPELELVPLRGSEDCCGAAGIYFLDNPDMSSSVLDPKLDALEESGAEVLVTGNPGCLLQWRAGIARRGLGVRALHPVTLLASSLVP